MWTWQLGGVRCWQGVTIAAANAQSEDCVAVVHARSNNHSACEASDDGAASEGGTRSLDTATASGKVVASVGVHVDGAAAKHDGVSHCVGRAGAVATHFDASVSHSEPDSEPEQVVQKAFEARTASLSMNVGS